MTTRILALPLLVTTLLLGGCDSDFATLTFERSVRKAPFGDELLPVYREQLEALMQAQGIDPTRITPRIKNSLGTELVLSEPIFGGLEPAQKTALQAALKAIVDARQAPLDMHLTLHPDDMPPSLPSAREKALELPREYDAHFTLDAVSLSVAFGMTDLVNAALKGSLNMQSEVMCNVTAQFEPALPFIGMKVPEEEGPYRTLMVKDLASAYSYDEIPVEVRFADPDLQALVSQQKVQVTSAITDRSTPFRNKRGLKQFEFIIGPVGTVNHENAKVDFHSHTDLAVKCEHLAGALGRPFSYKLGDSLDRLASVVFY
ncbi:hypothetical protein NRL37_10295 [Metapseudomonas otitidis]|uniref:hypothetical protein n=1 Tax=Metapseudomonas otitidis TaxID=319939 RepID=UPI00227BA12C|nr:hypothetical protein [Pseudomonas otitidis]WAF87810.1 hypothetical protein NRL37_10295 [Pseudomonas otitidis]